MEELLLVGVALVGAAFLFFKIFSLGGKKIEIKTQTGHNHKGEKKEDFDICYTCSSKNLAENSQALPLSNIKEGQEVSFFCVQGGRGVFSHLMQMGFVPNAEIKVLKNEGKGPLKLRIKGYEIAIGRKMAERVFVEEKIN